MKLNPKYKPIEEESAQLAEGTDTAGVLKRYWFMPDTHGLHKIMVERADIGMRQNVVRQFRKHFG